MNELFWATMFAATCSGQPQMYHDACYKASEATAKQAGWYQEVDRTEKLIINYSDKKARATVGDSVYEKTTTVVIAGLMAKKFNEGNKITVKVPRNPVYNNIYVEGAKQYGGLVLKFDF